MVYYFSTLRWAVFCAIQLLIVLTMGVKFLRLIWYLQRNVNLAAIPKLPIETTKSMIHYHRMVSLTCNNWSYELGKLISALLVGGAFFWGYMDFFLVKYYRTTPLSAYYVYVVMTLIVKIFYILLI